jgi:hypothetical protein
MRLLVHTLVTHNYRTSGPYNNHNVGVWYDGSRWSIFNEDITAIPAGAAFNVQVEGGMFTQTAYSANSAGDFMFFEHPSNAAASARFWSTHNYNPLSVTAQYNNHPLGVWFGLGTWTVFNQDIASPTGASFNFLAGTATDRSRADAAYIHTATASNSAGDFTILSNSSLDGNANASIIVTPNFNPNGTGNIYNNHPIGVWYTGSNWAIFNEDLTAIPAGAAFNVLIQR